MTPPAARRRVEVTVTGVVQAVGFRPFVYRRAQAHDLDGSVRNTGDAGVKITLEGESAAIAAFLDDLRERPPPLSVVESIDVEEADPVGETDFEIESSTSDQGTAGTIPPDTGICEACLADVRDPDSRYYGYWATSCVDCGPRYTVIESLPYDRPRTAMSAFPLCAECRDAYEDPTERRYHAQTIACSECGPELTLLGADRRERARKAAAIERTAEHLADGDLVAIRGIGGTHLACVATDAAVVERLRERTNRPSKPFALMAPDLPSIEQFANCSEADRAQLTDLRRPIVVLDVDRDSPEIEGETTGQEYRDSDWLDAVAPGLHTVGVMLPYAGLHHRLFDFLEGPLVMTSANLPGRPMATTVDEIFEGLDGVIDAALVHDRDIVARCDDSVVRVVDGTPRFLRRSRGWVPGTLPRGVDGPPALALGGEFDNTVALARDDEIIPSQHVGDVDGPATEQFLRETVAHLRELFGIDPALVACDMHPEFLTTSLAEEYANTDPVRVQHHHAHAAGLLAEHDLDRALVVTADGTGYGPDGTIWGGEVLDARPEAFERVGGLDSFHLPGGEGAVRRPTRTLASLLEDETRIDDLLVARTPLDESNAATVRQSLAAGVNAPETTSAGRLLDAVSALLGVCSTREYQGEPALRLEAVAAGATPLDLDVPMAWTDGRPVVDVSTLLQRLDELQERHPRERVAATAQAAIARGLGQIAVRQARSRGVSRVGFTGGVAYNAAISRRLRETVEDAGLSFFGPERVPPGDAGLAYGQLVVASARKDDGL